MSYDFNFYNMLVSLFLQGWLILSILITALIVTFFWDTDRVVVSVARKTILLIMAVYVVFSFMTTASMNMPKYQHVPTVVTKPVVKGEMQNLAPTGTTDQERLEYNQRLIDSNKVKGLE